MILPPKCLLMEVTELAEISLYGSISALNVADRLNERQIIAKVFS